MKDLQLCPLCNKETEEELDGKVCCSCGDILDFGYPSFPAYKLEDSLKKKLSIADR